MEEEIAWFDKYLFKETQTLPTREYVLPGSPLDSALRRAGSVSTDDGIFGQMLATSGKPEPILVPDMVVWEGINVSRFEITRAQFADFERSQPVGANEANFPATGMTLDEARKYCAWLSERTGMKYRLPNEDEADTLYGGSDGEENTLDRWAGYAVGPDDALKLQFEIARLGGHAPLLRPVGSFSASIDSADPKVAVFDLGGNAAEWITLEDGGGELRGGSADQPADAKTKSSAAAPDYRGFRVVMEGAK